MKKGSKHTPESLIKIGLSGKGRIPWNKGKKMKELIPGFISPNLGKKASDETKKRLSESHKKFYKTKNGKIRKKEHSKNHSKVMKKIYKTQLGKKIKEKQRKWNKEHNKEHTQKLIDSGHYERLGKKNSKLLKKYFSTPEGKEAGKKARIKANKTMKKWYKTPAGIKRRQQQSEFAQQLCQRSGTKKYKVLYKKKYIWMRSKAEIAVAKYLIKNNIEFIYETDINKFKLTETTSYLNDFYLPKENIFIQVKGNYAGKYYINTGINKYNLAVKLYPNVNFELWDVKKMKELGIKYGR